MAILQEMNKDPDSRTKFKFVAIPRDPKTKAWSEAEAVTLVSFDTYFIDWDGQMRCSGLNQALRTAMECNFQITYPDAEEQDDEPVPVYVPIKTSMHAVAMIGPNANVMKESSVNIHPRKLHYKHDARQGYFCYDEKAKKPLPLKEENVKVLEQAFDDAKTAAADTGLDKPKGHIFIARHKKDFEKFKSFVGREVKWEYRLAEAS